jgi:hypothetical protein
MNSARFRTLVVAYGVAVVLTTAFAWLTCGDTEWWLVGALGLLFVLAEHRDRVFVDETGLSGSIAVALAAAYFFASEGWVGGAFLCCALGGLYVPHLRDRAFSKIVINSASFGLSACATSGVLSIVSTLELSVAEALIALLVGVGTYWIINSLLLSIATAAMSGERVRSQLVQLIRSDTVMLAFGFGGGICGVVMVEVGVWTGLSTLVALLVALDVFVISVPAGLTVLRSAWVIVLARGVSGSVAGTVGAVVTRGLAISVLGAIAGLVSGVVAGAVVVVCIVGARLLVRHRHVDLALLAGLVTAESAFPIIGATCGVAVAVAGLSTGLIVASGVVVVGSLGVAWRRRSRKVGPLVDDDVLMAAVVEAMLDGLPSPTRDR